MTAKKAITAIGRRKSASARVYMFPVDDGETADLTINGRTFENFFVSAITRQTVMKPLEVAERIGKYRFRIRTTGGGYTGQAGATVLGIARALEKAEPELRPALKKAGFFTRDPRVVERKKPGKRKARKSTQFSKR